jgi:hypothetical protein
MFEKMKINTITTIELSSVCNLECEYCINRLLVEHPARKPGIMTDAVFDRCVEVVKELVDRGTQKEINLNGNGESLLDPLLVRRIDKLRKSIGENATIMLSTNGTLVNRELAAALKSAGLTRIDVSPHKPAVARKVIHYLAEAGLNGVVNWGLIGQSHNWAGQLEPENRVPVEPQGVVCYPLLIGAGYVQSEGDVVPCCYDYRNLGWIGHILDDTILDRPIKQYALCKSCHQIIAEKVVKRDAKAHPASYAN